MRGKFTAQDGNAGSQGSGCYDTEIAQVALSHCTDELTDVYILTNMDRALTVPSKGYKGL
jgi:hypothetical protein